MNTIHRLLLLCVLAAIAVSPAAAQTYPSRPIRLIVPIAAGSISDVILRAASQEIAPRLGQTLLIDNRAGASMIIGGELCARAAPDGYTICAVNFNTLSLNPLLFSKLPYDADRDFALITNLYVSTEVLVVPANVPANSVAELKALALARPGTLNSGTMGEGSLSDLFLAWLNSHWKTSIAAIPYKGAGAIALAVTGGELQIGAMGIGNFAGHIRSGKVKPLAVSHRSPLLPGVPTYAEVGLGDFHIHPWWGLAAPAGTPEAILARLNAEFVRAFRDPKFVEFLDARGIQSTVGTPAEFAAFVKEDRESAAVLVKLARVPRK